MFTYKEYAHAPEMTYIYIVHFTVKKKVTNTEHKTSVMFHNVLNSGDLYRKIQKHMEHISNTVNALAIVETINRVDVPVCEVPKKKS